MKYSNQLMPGFVSEPMFDVNGNQFYTLSVEADGRRNLETFDFQPPSCTFFHQKAHMAQLLITFANAICINSLVNA